ncbi:MAG: DUF924 domain-containing protein [Acetobacteraceae bacterium]|nr:DUF924 domain-containing protein [Acetobacteraceae bacterium]
MIDIWCAAAALAGTGTRDAQDWRAVYDFWFPPGLDAADPHTLRRQVEWWFGGGSNDALPPFAPVLEVAKAGRLDGWTATPRGRLSLILVLDQFPRGLFAGTPEAYASDPAALRIAEEGLRNGHHAALAEPWEKMFAAMPLVHAEGPGHRERLERVVALAERIAREVPEPLRPIYEFSANQARGHLDVVTRFGRFPHRNPVLGRASTPEEEAYLAKGDFVHMRRMPGS